MNNPDLVQAQIRLQDHARTHRSDRLSSLREAGPLCTASVDDIVDAICDLTPPDARPYRRENLPEVISRNLDGDPGGGWLEGPISLLPATWARLNAIALRHGVEVGDLVEHLALDSSDMTLETAAAKGRAYLDGCSECQGLLDAAMKHAGG